jgi:hypothetical protein
MQETELEVMPADVETLKNVVAEKDKQIDFLELERIKDANFIHKQEAKIKRLTAQKEKCIEVLKDAFIDGDFKEFMQLRFEENHCYNQWKAFCKSECPMDDDDNYCKKCFEIECEEDEPNCGGCPGNDTCEDARNYTGGL